MPDDLVHQIDALAKQYGVSRSAYMVLSMSQKVQSENVMQSMPEMRNMMAELQLKLGKMKTPDDVGGKS